MSYDEAVEESLCFGWIDGLVRRIDDQTHMQRYTPRRPGSAWSALNLRRFARMVDAGQMTDAGRKRGPTAETKVAPQSWHRPDVVPDEIARILKRSPKAWTNLLAMAPSYRKRVVTWLENAKRPETREKRAKDIDRAPRAQRKAGDGVPQEAATEAGLKHAPRITTACYGCAGRAAAPSGCVPAMNASVIVLVAVRRRAGGLVHRHEDDVARCLELRRGSRGRAWRGRPSSPRSRSAARRSRPSRRCPSDFFSS